MATYISENTDQATPILCRYCGDYKGGEKFYPMPTRVAAVRLRGQWQGGDHDVDPHWVPVCWEHDSRWDVNVDTEEREDPKYQLPAFDLTNWWVVIARDGSYSDPRTSKKTDIKDVMIGPYPSEEDAAHAMDNALLVEAELQEGGTDCFVQGEPGSVNTDAFEVVLIHLDDPTYTGRDA